jgi:nitrogen fixation protein NifT
MKVMMRRNSEGQLSAYVPKKDLEEPVVAQEKPGIWGGWIRLANGWQLQMPEMAPETSLPITVEARKLAEAD